MKQIFQFWRLALALAAFPPSLGGQMGTFLPYTEYTLGLLQAPDAASAVNSLGITATNIAGNFPAYVNTTNATWRHVRGDAEMAGNADYGWIVTNTYGVGLREYITNNMTILAVRAPVWRRLADGYVRMKMFEKDAPTSFNIASTAAISSNQIYTLQSSSNTINTFPLATPLAVNRNKYLYITFESDAARTVMSTWTNNSAAGDRHAFAMINGAGDLTESVTNLGFYGATFELLGVTSRPVTNLSAFLNAISAAAIVGTYSFTPQVTTSLWKHPRGDDELAGNATYNYWGLGYWERVTTPGKLKAIRLPVWGANATNQVTMKIFQRPAAGTFNTRTNAAAYTNLVTLGQGHTNTVALTAPLELLPASYLYITFECAYSLAELYTARWTNDPYGDRHALTYITTNGDMNLGGAAYKQATFELLSETAGSSDLNSALTGLSASTLPLTPPAGMAATTVQNAIAELYRPSSRILLPDEFVGVVGDKLQLFVRGMIEAANPYGAPYDIVCAKGANYPRYWEFTPTNTETGTYVFTVNLLNLEGMTNGTKSANLVIVNTNAAPVTTKDVLCVGDSLTQGGQWPAEFYRRLTQTGGSPAGLGFTNINFIGVTAMTSYPTQKYVGYGGWAWSTYLAPGSPFHTNGVSSFTNWAATYGATNISVCYILLGWNGLTANAAQATNHASTMVQAQTFITQLHADYPNAQIRLVGLQAPSMSGGLGANYGATGHYAQYYKLLRSVNGLNLAYQELANNPTNSAFTRFINLSCQFDSENNMPAAATAVNSRNAATELRGSNGVHPDTTGYYQIADAVYRDFIRSFCN